MRRQLACVVVTLVLVGADNPSVDLVRTWPTFPPGSRWELVRGWKGERPVETASLEFLEEDQFKLKWEYETEQGRSRGTVLYLTFGRDPLSGMLVVWFRSPFGQWEGRFRLVGELLEVRLMGDH